MKCHRSTVVALATLSCALTASATASGFKIVANPSVPVASLSRAAASSAFLKKTEKWADGTPVVPVDLAPDSRLRQAFCREVHDKSPAMIDAYWQKQVFSGRTTPPLSKATDADVIAYVKSVPGAIGYVSSTAETSGLKEVRLE